MYKLKQTPLNQLQFKEPSETSVPQQRYGSMTYHKGLAKILKGIILKYMKHGSKGITNIWVAFT